MSDDPWAAWAAQRPPARVLHLDSAAAGRQSRATLDTVAAHARLEAETGAYVAQESVIGVRDELKAALAGLLGVVPDGLAFLESGTNALAALLRSWPFPEQASIGVLPVEWGPNLEAFAERGLDRVALPADADGRLDLEAFATLVSSSPPSVVHLTQVTSHRGLLQPVAEAVSIARAAGVPVWVDAAQALGHVDCATGADALYATGRKWLTGPRGVGVLAVADSYRESLRVFRSAMHPDLPAVAYLESHETHVAGRVGLANAVREHLALGPAAVYERLREVGAATHDALGEVPGWELTPGADTAITALRPTAGQDVFDVRARLLAEHGILVTAETTARSPGDMREPLLRVSPHVDCTPEHLDRLARALGPG